MALRLFAIDYLSPKQLDGFKKYKYRSVDTSPLSRYVMHPFWDQVVKIYPMWLAPNLMTFIGWLLTLFNFLVLSYFDWDFSGTAQIGSSFPSWLWFLCGVSQFLSHTLDGTDGKQARRTHSSSPLGEMFDHGLDSIAIFLMPMSLFTIVSTTVHAIDEFYIAMLVLMAGFFISHWEKYNTSVLYLPWAYDVSQVGLAGAYIATSFLGPDIWKVWKLGTLFKFLVHFSLWGLGLPVSIWHIIRARLKHPECCPDVKEGLMPLVPLLSLFSIFSAWVWLSPDVLNNHSRILLCALGTVFSNITCRLIVAQMSSTKCERFNWLLIPLIPIVLSSLRWPGLEKYLLFGYFVLVVAAHVHYGMCVVNQLCDFLKVRCFVITAPKTVSNGH